MRFTLKKKIILLVIIPALLIGAAALVVSNIMVTNSMEAEIFQQLKIAAYSGVEHYTYSNSDQFSRDADGTVKKGEGLIISGNNDYVDNLLEKGEIQTTFFYGDERIVTSIKDDSGERIIGTKASGSVIDIVLKQGKDFKTSDIVINGESFYGFYTPIRQTGSEEIVGMFFAGDRVSQVDKIIRSINYTIGVAIIGILLISVVLAIIIVLSITKALNRTVSQLDELSQGSLVFEENEKDKKRKDEIGDLVQASLRLKKSLTKIIKKVSETSNVLYSATEELEQVANQTTTTTEGIEKAVEDMASGAVSQSEATQEASTQIHIMGEGIEQTSIAVATLRSNSSIMSQSSMEALSRLNELNLVNLKTQKAVDDIYRQTNETNEFAQKIKEATNVITAIAEETNLLSLNASIEAARAGESGRGFAIVAEQIKKLAEQSSESTKIIEDIIQTLIQNSDRAVDIMKEVRTVSASQNDTLEKTKTAFQMVADGIDDSVESVNSIATITSQLTTVRKNVIDLITSLSAVSEENAASTEETSAASAELTSAMNNVEEEISVLQKLAEDLAKSIQIFKL